MVAYIVADVKGYRPVIRCFAYGIIAESWTCYSKSLANSLACTLVVRWASTLTVEGITADPPFADVYYSVSAAC